MEAVTTAVVSDAPAAATAEASGPHQSIRIEGAQPVNIIHLQAADRDEPTPADLAEIEREDDVIAAELDLLGAEIAFITAGPAVSVLDRRRVRRAERRVLRARRELAAELAADETAADGAA